MVLVNSPRRAAGPKATSEPMIKTPKPTQKRPRNAQSTRDRILKIATKEFAAHGYDGARIDAIVARCKISKNLIYHYFAGKEALFIEVIEEAYGAMRERQNELAMSGENPEADMRDLVTKTIQHFIDQPDLLRLLSTENLHKAVHIRKSKKIPAMFNPLRTTLAEVLDKGKAQGVFRRDADWVDLYVSISGLGAYFITNRYTLTFVLGVDLGTPERVKGRLQHAADMVISYLCDKPSVSAASD